MGRIRLLSDVIGCVLAALFLAIGVSISAFAAGELEIPFTLNKPAGDGPFPAVVILHDCSGLGPRSSAAPWRWSTRLVARGYVTIWPDSFSTRGFPEGVCTAPDGANVSSRLRANDAAAALAYLKTLPYVDGKRIAVMGGSHGGSATLAAIVDRGVGGAPSAGFAAAIALYPGCAWSYGDWSVEREAGTGGGRPIVAYKGVFKPLAPLLILTGALDDWTPAEPCRQLAERAKAAGHAVDIMIYPGAHHSFDSRNPVVFNAQRRNANAAGGRGATTGGNAEAWTAAVRDVEGFLGTWLGK